MVWQLNSDIFPSYSSYSRIKCWVDILTAEGLNGLLVEPNSHKRTDIIWHGEYRHGIKKPLLDMKPDQIDTLMVPTKKANAYYSMMICFMAVVLIRLPTSYQF